jgi:hypothetical protein
MARKQPDPETPETAADLAAEPIAIHAHEGPVFEPKFAAATDDPAHPLHHHAKRDSLESPPSKD